MLKDDLRVQLQATLGDDYELERELIDIASINKAYERILKREVRYRFLIDMASLT